MYILSDIGGLLEKARVYKKEVDAADPKWTLLMRMRRTGKSERGRRILVQNEAKND